MVALVVELGRGEGGDARAVTGHRIVSSLADVSMILPTAGRAVVGGVLGKENVVRPGRVGNPGARSLFRAGPVHPNEIQLDGVNLQRDGRCRAGRVVLDRGPGQG